MKGFPITRVPWVSLLTTLSAVSHFSDWWEICDSTTDTLIIARTLPNKQTARGEADNPVFRAYLNPTTTRKQEGIHLFGWMQSPHVYNRLLEAYSAYKKSTHSG